ncbi:MAG: hypothetical protein MZV70_63230 [Desulfobacterales bacterium]|nr:hypothetical protein [Desulfobacterales bacterium]
MHSITSTRTVETARRTHRFPRKHATSLFPVTPPTSTPMPPKLKSRRSAKSPT